MEKFIPLSVPNLKGNELKYVTDAIEAEWVSTGGSYITKFEEEIANYVHVPSAVACQSGTAALHLALLGAGVKAGDEVIAPTLTFIAAVNPIAYVGAEPVFMDCQDDFTIDIVKLERFLSEECTKTESGLINNKTGKTIKAIVVVHVFGNLVDMEKIMQLANAYGLKVIEDATEAIGSYYTEGIYKGKRAGTIGDFGAYSFNGNKIITTGGGGMLVARCQKDLDRARYLSTQAKDDMLNFIHNDIGYNYRMTNVQAAIGLGQVEQLDSFIETKERNFELYKSLLEDVEGVELLDYTGDNKLNYWFYAVHIDPTYAGLTVSELIEAFGQRKIQTRPIWGLIHEQMPYREKQAYQIEKALMYRNTIINVPCSTNLSEEDVRYVVEVLKDIIKEKVSSKAGK